MDELDLKLSALRNATENLAPTPSGLEQIHQAVNRLALGRAAGAAGSSASGVGGTFLGAKTFWLVSTIALSLLGGLLFRLTHSATPSSPPTATVSPSSPAQAPVAPDQRAACDSSRMELQPTSAPPLGALPAFPMGRGFPRNQCMGWLVTSSSRAAEVLVDGMPTGRRTPILLSAPLQLPAVEHRITYRTARGKTTTQNVKINCGETTRLWDVRWDSSLDDELGSKAKPLVAPAEPASPLEEPSEGGEVGGVPGGITGEVIDATDSQTSPAPKREPIQAR
jgi:hypothetical protein